MADFVLIAGDTVTFLPTFGAAVVVPRPGKLEGSGPATLRGKPLCVVGDEGKVAVAGCPYLTPSFPIPGQGTLKIAALAGDQQASKTKTGGKAVLLRGTQFTATFEVQAPATLSTPGGPVSDPTPQYSGHGLFVTTNTIFSGV